ncbi:MAG: ribosome small subunit-dependent GTPase A [Anaerolineaceae bacterium]|nr:ribosome small subunit-dependent GTPase A [Anaerolineaceae bacterium]
MAKNLKTGIVLSYKSGFYDVEIGTERVVCFLRGRFKRGPKTADLVAIGDRVQVMMQPDGTGMIEEIEDRASALVRLAPTPRGVYQQVLLANPDQVVFIFACANPEPHLRMLDRFLVIAEKNELPPLIVANKVDIIGMEAAKAIFGLYEPIGYKVIYASAETGEGVEELHDHLRGKISAFTGPSGVGKSSLLNQIIPGLDLHTSNISDVTDRGRHTTTHRELFHLPDGGYVADTPGIRGLSLWDTEPEELDGYFPELRGLVRHCQFNDCTHREGEPGCAVRAAVHEGSVHPDRYISYLRMRFGDDE